MEEIFVIEKMVVLGIWELLTDIFYTDEKKALDDCINITKTMQKRDKNFSARVTKLTLNKEG